jgi:SWI/SNF-related matrix-associated actin-dependent regulator of chromatin subfamily A-like protein 1
MNPKPDLFHFQRIGTRFALEREAALIADEMGLGKTAQAIGVINADPSIRSVLIVCPASVRIPWRRELEIFCVLSWLDPQRWPANGWFHFGQRYCGAKHNGFGWDLGGSSHLSELSTVLRSSVMIRRTKPEVLHELPPKIRTVIELYPSAGMKRVLKREMDVYEARYLKVDHRSINWDDLARVRHQTALSKVPLVIEYVLEVFAGGVKKLVLFAHHRDVIAQLAKGLSRFNPVVLVGGTLPQDRQRAIDAFQNDSSVRLFIGNIQAAGTGITLAPASSHCIFAELSRVPAELSQCEDRLHRIGTTDSVLVQHLVLEGSLDAMMVRVLLKKQKILDAVLT